MTITIFGFGLGLNTEGSSSLVSTNQLFTLEKYLTQVNTYSDNYKYHLLKPMDTVKYDEQIEMLKFFLTLSVIKNQTHCLLAVFNMLQRRLTNCFKILQSILGSMYKLTLSFKQLSNYFDSK